VPAPASSQARVQSSATDSVLGSGSGSVSDAPKTMFEKTLLSEPWNKVGTKKGTKKGTNGGTKKGTNSVNSQKSVTKSMHGSTNQRSRSSSREEELVDASTSISTSTDMSTSTDLSTITCGDARKVISTLSDKHDSSNEFDEHNAKTSTSSEESDYTDCSKFSGSEGNSPILTHSSGTPHSPHKSHDLDKSPLEIVKKGKGSTVDKSRTKNRVGETDFLNPDWKLPGGDKYRKGGVRLENALFNALPKSMKNSVSLNVKPRHPNGNVIVEFDMLYQSDSSSRIVSFEIKGVNPNTINNLERQKKLILQGLKQKQYLEDNYPSYKVDAIFCFVTGKIKSCEIVDNPETETDSEWKSVKIVKSKSMLDADFIKQIKLNGIHVAIGETPQQCAKNALLILNLLR
jgi:hypothetical protein